MIIYHQKVIFTHKIVPYSTEKIIQPHLFDIFTPKHDLRTSMGQIAQDAWIGRGCCQPNLGNAWILGTNGPAAHPLGIQY